MIIPILLTLLIIALFAFLAMIPETGRQEELTVIRTDYAHRGLHDEIRPENSLAAFRAAIEAGYGIELDVRLTADKIPVVFHDDTAARVCGAEEKISDMTLDVLRGLRLSGTEEQIPTFAEVLSLVAGQVPILVELKGENGNTEVCERAAELLDNYDGVFSVESFNPLYLSWFREHRPVYFRGLLYTNLFKEKTAHKPWLKFLLGAMFLNFLARPDFIAYNHLYPAEFPLWLCRRFFRLPCMTWTVRDEQTCMHCPQDDALIFEHFTPDR